MSANEITIQAAETTITEGRVLHVRADRLPAKRGKDRRDAQPAVDLTVGPDARGGFLVVDYSRVASGVEERFETATLAVRAVRKALTWDRIASLRAALVAVHGEAGQSPSLAIEDARLVSMGARMRGAFEHRGGIVGSLFGPGGHGLV